MRGSTPRARGWLAPPTMGSRAASLAAALAGLERYDEAIVEHDRCLARHPDDTAVRRELARTLSWAGGGHLARALVEDERLAAVAPDDAVLGVERARVLAWDGQLTESAAAFAALRVAAPAQAARGTGDVWAWGGQPGVAAAWYRRALDAGAASEDAEVARRYLAADAWQREIAPTATLIEDSDRLLARRYAVDGRLRLDGTTDLGAGFVHGDYHQRGEDVRVERARFSVARDLAPGWQVDAAYGPNVYDDGRATQSGAGRVTRRIGPESLLAVGYDHYDLLDEVLTVASARGGVLQGDRVRVAGRHVLPGRLEVTGTAAWVHVSDGNRSVAAGVTLGRRVLRVPDLRVVADAAWLSYEARSDRYWDPARYVSSGLGLEVRHSVWRVATLSGTARAGYGREDGAGALELAWGVHLETAEYRGLSVLIAYGSGTTNRGGGDPGGYSSQTATAGFRWRWSPS
ncbi:MAG: hypothetical protein U0807_01855 [Candidatus Binatia bacterium]